jgi:starch phosphorylase
MTDERLERLQESGGGNGNGETPEVVVENDRTGMDPITLERAVLDHLYYSCSKDERSTTPADIFHAVALATRDRLVHRWIKTQRTYYEKDVKRAYYLSAEFLLGRALALNLINLGQYEVARVLLLKYGIDLGRLLEHEADPGLGNGGLGRLAACFLDSMATLALPGNGYGIRYEFGIFEQRLQDGWQVEHPDTWLRLGNVWEIPRHERTVTVNFYGRVEQQQVNGQMRTRWVETQQVLAVPYDLPVAGYNNNTVNNLRLWSAQATNEFNLQVFNDGDYRRAVEEKALSESISKVLYPKDDTPEGRELRLKQQYFFVCASIHDILRRYKSTHDNLDQLPDKVAIQLNDTHPSIAVAELMRVLLDDEGLPWDRAWELTQKTAAYTNHTLLPEALERWPVSLFERLLPRHLQIIYEINHRFMNHVHVVSSGDAELQRRTSIIEEGPERQVRMAHLAVVGSHSVNGVAQLHTKLIKSHLLPDFARLFPERFNNKTNGVTPRRWLLLSNPGLAKVITERLGREWITDLDQLARLRPLADDAGFHEELRAVKRRNKVHLAAVIKRRTGTLVDPDSIFDVQVKRIHEYKRQLLNCMHIISLYWRIKDDPGAEVVPRTFIFAGKAAPGYVAAKLQIKLINDVAAIVNNDPAVAGRIKVVFLPNYSVSLAERIFPASDLSEQISLAGMEASGTGNMKFTMNGALTAGTLDGANIEIREEVGEENFFLFGLTAEQVEALRHGGYNPLRYIEQSERLQRVLARIGDGYFSPDDRGRFSSLAGDLSGHDHYMHCADFEDYVHCQEQVEQAYLDRKRWMQMVVHNLAGSGRFSSDRTIRNYAEEIWDVKPVPIELDEEELASVRERATTEMPSLKR